MKWFSSVTALICPADATKTVCWEYSPIMSSTLIVCVAVVVAA